MRWKKPVAGCMVYEYENKWILREECRMRFVQVNCDNKKSIFELCKLIIYETEQNKGYGTKILSEVINWLGFEEGC